MTDIPIKVDKKPTKNRNAESMYKSCKKTKKKDTLIHKIQQKQAVNFE
jgi:hypothetical protein